MTDDPRQAYKARFERELEPERYEIFELLQEEPVTGHRLPGTGVTRQVEPAPAVSGLDRRAFLALGGGLLFLVSVRAQGRDVPVRVQVAPDGRYRAFTGKVDMGQGARALLTQAFAEELGVTVDRVELVMGDTDLCPDDGGTWASLTTPQTVPVIRRAAAAVRARQTGGSDALTPPADWRVLGQSVRRLDGRAIVTGTRDYPTDLRVAGMQHAVIVRSPHHKATLASLDTSAAETVDGVRILRDGDLVAAVSPEPGRARRAAALVRATWTPTPLTPQADWPALFRKTANAPVEQPEARYPPLFRQGDVDAALRGAVRTRTDSYGLAPIAHVPLEPRAAIATWDGNRVTVQSGAQAPFLVRQEVARACGVPESQVRIVVTGAGGAFGGKQRGECEVEAARLARLAGVPVRVAWTREEEFTCSYTRPAGVLDVESGVGADGRLVAVKFTNFNSGAAGLRWPYDVPHHWIGFARTQSDVRQGSYRSLAAVANAFARESTMDAWAADLGVDPKAFRLRHVSDARLRAVIEETTRRFGWDSKGRAGTAGRGVGLSCTIEKDARLALCVEVEMRKGAPHVTRMVATGDFGAALNPDALQNQMTGALIQGIGGALWEAVAFDGTAQLTRRLSGYRVPRFSDMPQMDVQVIDRRDIEPAGAGESSITLTAPAVAAAIALATGERRRSLPLWPGRGTV
ncbi:aldehyde oxidase [Luteitalea sp. TBR-22]|uniref:xanthine dehydrogenase family protein molybdopterin-binding subunit n=1 Tax=Luteitalea sp. TBR-22 TaxID=2802971 RepID=UPI001AFB3020|nr:xanthine dehydrogenase family protein [Luteitalea sp. TBR-22]BCS32507.1 aldehyde oxidase [Luteitalea sp. TBR-22]